MIQTHIEPIQPNQPNLLQTYYGMHLLCMIETYIDIHLVMHNANIYEMRLLRMIKTYIARLF